MDTLSGVQDKFARLRRAIREKQKVIYVIEVIMTSMVKSMVHVSVLRRVAVMMVGVNSRYSSCYLFVPLWQCPVSEIDIWTTKWALSPLYMPLQIMKLFKSVSCPWQAAVRKFPEAR